MLHIGGIALFDIANQWARRLEAECFPVVGKVPAKGHEWRKNALGRPGTHQATYDAWNEATGYAITPIPGSTLAIIDIDDPTFTPKLLEKFPALRTALTVSRDDHKHIYVRLEKPLPKSHASISNAGSEIASLRGAGAYVVGPYSQHPSGSTYKPANSSPAKLDVLQTAALLYLFGIEGLPSPERTGGAGNRQLIAPAKQTAAPAKLLRLMLTHFEDAGYQQRYDAERDLWWLNGQCPNTKNHPEGDHHPSFGFNNQGMGHCFKCGWMKAIDLAPKVGIYPIHYRDAAATPARRTVKREQRAELIAQGYTRAVRLIDLLTVSRNRDRYRWTLRELITVGQRVEWSIATTCRNIRQAVEAGLLTRLRPGVYARRGEFDDPAPGLPFGERYSAHPVNYRRGICLRTQQRVQPTAPTAYNPSAARIAYLTGVSERTLYRYEKTMGIHRLQVWERTPIAADFSSPASFYGPSAPAGQRRDGYWRYEVMTRAGVIRRFGPTEYLAAADVAQQEGGIVLCSRRLPSIRVMPSQRWEDRVPADCRVSDDYGRVYVDPPYLRRLVEQSDPLRLSHHGISAGAHPTLGRGLRMRPALINDSSPTDKHDKQPDHAVIDERTAESLRQMKRRAAKSRNPFRQIQT